MTQQLTNKNRHHRWFFDFIFSHFLACLFYFVRLPHSQNLVVKEPCFGHSEMCRGFCHEVSCGHFFLEIQGRAEQGKHYILPNFSHVFRPCTRKFRLNCETFRLNFGLGDYVIYVQKLWPSVFAPFFCTVYLLPCSTAISPDPTTVCPGPSLPQ